MKIKDMPPLTGEQSNINIAPLIDIVFILLIFFMVTTTFNKDFWLELERPEAQSATARQTETLRIRIDRYGDVFLEGKAIHTWMLQNKLKEKLSRRVNKDVLVIADRRLESGVLIHLVDQCRLAGASDVGVSTESKS